MFKDYLSSVEGIETYPTIALIIFFSIFLGVVLYAVFMDKKHEYNMGHLPFDGQINSSTSGEKNG